MSVILSSRNPSKAEQIKAVFSDVPISICTLTDVGIEGEAVEDGASLEENARKKAVFAHKLGHWSMADDTGLFIHALDGRPGIYAARWAGETATSDEIITYTLQHMEGAKDRTATFRTVVVLIDPSGNEKVFSGEAVGKILTAPRLKPQPKMPYSAIFVPDGSEKVWAEMSVEEENAISHRGKAFRLAREYLLEQLK